jgi:hypothetical protein
MSRLFLFARLVISAGVVAAHALPAMSANETLIEPVDPYGMFEPDPVAGRAKTASAAADAAQAGAAWVNELGVNERVSQLVLKENDTIKNLLVESGQAGVLYRVDIQRIEREMPVYSVVGDTIQRVGTGSSPLAVNSAANQQAQIGTSPSTGATVDPENSYFIWFSSDGTDMVATTISSQSLIRQTALQFSDEKLLLTLNEANKAKALGAGVARLEKRTTDDALRQKLIALRTRQIATNQQATEIGKRLEKELAKAKKAQSVATTLSLISGALTLASQAASLKAALGADAPANAIDNARSPADLQQIAEDVETSATNNVEQLRIDYKGVIDQSDGIKTEFLQILIETKYPINEVPELRLH